MGWIFLITHTQKNLEMIKFDSKICQITWERMNGDTILEPVWLSKHGSTRI